MADLSELIDHQISPLVAESTRLLEPEYNKRFWPPRRYTPNLLSGVYRNIRELPSVRPSRSPSRVDLENNSPGLCSTYSPTASVGEGNSRTSDLPAIHDARNINLRYDLAKPLPRLPVLRTDTASPQGPGITGNSPSIPEVRVSGTSNIGPLPIAIWSKISGRRGSIGSETSAPPAHIPDAQVANNSPGSLSRSARYGGSEETYSNSKPLVTVPALPGPSPDIAHGRSATVGGLSHGSSTRLSSLVCNVHQTTGHRPHALVGAITTILGDRLYVFGGRTLSRGTPGPITSDLYELNLIKRHWTKLETTGDNPLPRYFHSMCPLGDIKMVCYGGMSPAPNQLAEANQLQTETMVMSDIHIYDIHTRVWTFIPTQDPPQGRYAHCASILPSSAAFSSHRAPLSALQHKPSTRRPNERQIGVNHVGNGGAEMVVVGGQDGRNNYIEQVSVFNLRSLEWTSTQLLKRSYGTYRSMTAPLTPAMTAKIDCAQNGMDGKDRGVDQAAQEPRSSMLIYSNYNFLDLKLELGIWTPDGTLNEKPTLGAYAPPGLRFPNGGVINTHLLVGGTYLTSSKQEYALWALDLRSLTWSRIDAGGSILSQGSWNRGVVWNRRNAFVILGNQKRNLVDDYNHRRINFSNICMVELEAFGFYDNPLKTSPLSGFISVSSAYSGSGLSLTCKGGCPAGGRDHSRASEELGKQAFTLRELADMDILCIDGERIPVNSRILERRWGPFFVRLLQEGAAAQDGSDVMTLCNDMANHSLQGPPTTTFTPSSSTSENNSTNSTTGSPIARSRVPPKIAASILPGSAMAFGGVANPAKVDVIPTPRSLPPNSKSRCLYLPHTYLTIQALLHFLYTNSLPPPSSPFCTLQILCSLLQIARPYRIDGLLEAIVERLHTPPNSRNAAAIFNASAMAAGGGRGIDGLLNVNLFTGNLSSVGSSTSISDFSLAGGTASSSFLSLPRSPDDNITRDTNVQQSGQPPGHKLSEAISQTTSELGFSESGTRERENFVWDGEFSSVIGLQKRGLFGLMQGRMMRGETGTGGASGTKPE